MGNTWVDILNRRRETSHGSGNEMVILIPETFENARAKVFLQSEDRFEQMSNHASVSSDSWIHQFKECRKMQFRRISESVQ